MKYKKISDSTGFTILELIIATTVFGLMLLVATTGMIQIGRAYYKGTIVAKTQEGTRGVVEDITKTIQFGGNVSIVTDQTPPIVLASGLSSHATCIGNQRYTYVVGQRIDPKTSAKHALWFDVKKEGALCSPVDLDNANPSYSGGANGGTVDTTKTSVQRELLSKGMRLAKFSIVDQGTSGATVTVKVIYGEDDLLLDKTDPNANCVSSSIGGQFCAFSELTTFVTKRL